MAGKKERCKACFYYYNGECEIGEIMPDGKFCWTFMTGPDVGAENAEKLYELNESWCEFKQCIDCVKDYCDKDLPDSQPCPDRMDAEQLHALYREKGIENGN